MTEFPAQTPRVEMHGPDGMKIVLIGVDVGELRSLMQTDGAADGDVAIRGGGGVCGSACGNSAGYICGMGCHPK